MSDSPQTMVEHYQQDERARILGMVPGPEMDREVAEKVMGWHICHYDKDHPDNCYYLLVDGVDAVEPLSTGYDTEEQAWVDCPLFSSDVAAAMVVVEKINGKCGFSLGRAGVYEPDRKWNARIGKIEWVEADTAPEAICKAALIAVLAVMG